MRMRWFTPAGRGCLGTLVGLIGVAFLWAWFNSPAVSPLAPPEATQAADSASQGQAAHPHPMRQTSPGTAEQSGAEDLVMGPVMAESAPVRLSIPRLGVDSLLERLGVQETGVMEVPHDAALAGWYTRGPTPGALGPAVIAGHVTWDEAPAVFFRLGELQPGDRIKVAREDGKEAVFTVARTAIHPKTHFPTRAVFGGIDHAGLRLVTCGGEYDDSTHRYADNVVVFARLVAVHAARN